MFTGIVQAYVSVAAIVEKPGLITFSLIFPDELRVELQTGASVAVDGVCFTMVKVEHNQVFFDAMQETLQRTTIGLLKTGQFVNVERSFKIGDEVGGHLLSGHVHGTAEITSIDTSIPNNQVVTFKIPHHLTKYIFTKGFVALNGVSLTLVEVDKKNAAFTVYFIPETLKRTTFGSKQVGDRVNIEIDSQTQAIVETVERILAEKDLNSTA
jgi:riboflavin synthase